MSIYPIILSGGSGTRLWPLSRSEYPKQLLSITSENSLLQETLLRFTDNKYEPPLVICNSAHRFIVAEQIRSINLNVHDIILERYGRNTAPAATIASMALSAHDENATVLLLPSDHQIRNQEAFNTAISSAIAAAKDYIVSFGITPTGPETGYGYIMSSDEIICAPGCFKVSHFVEKPSLEKCQKMINSGNYNWNSGIYLFKASIFLEELKIFQPKVFEACEKAYSKITRDLDFLRLDEKEFKKCPSISIDYAVMEHTKKAAVLPVDLNWSDIGSWSELWEISNKDLDGNVKSGDIVTEDTKNSYLRSNHRLVATIGLSNVVIINTEDTVLVANKDRVQDISKIVQQLDKSNRKEHITPVRQHRPWGWYQSIDSGTSFQVKRICVNPSSRLSLQRHKKRAEHWVVVSGRATVYCEGKCVNLEANESTYIPVGASHRLENTTDKPLYLIEVQSGEYLGEDDIERLDDDFARK